MAGAIRLYHSFLRKGSTALRRPPFFDFVRRLFFPCHMIYVGIRREVAGAKGTKRH